MALPTAPDWLTKRSGLLKPGIADHIVFVMLDGKPHYRLDVRPAGGQFSCAVTQTINGKRLDAEAKFATAEAAVAGGLDALRNKMGW
jgi:hypothetical protein